MREILVISGWAALSLFACAIGLRVRNARRSRDRLYGPMEAEPAVIPASDVDYGFLGLKHWLTLAGIRGGGVVGGFVLAALIALALGIIAALAMDRLGLVEMGTGWISAIPGAPGDVLRLSLVASPWIALVLLASMPWLYVRGLRRKRVKQIEQDLPISLELLATLGEAGLGFDAAVDRLLEAQPLNRPIMREFRQLQVEALAGVPRVECLRRISRRIEVSAVSIFISALVQAEQVGAGMADVLRRQADDLRSRRREAAMTSAQAVPVKLTFPLVICFLPGIFVTTLGPTFYRFFQLADNVMRQAN